MFNAVYPNTCGFNLSCKQSWHKTIFENHFYFNARFKVSHHILDNNARKYNSLFKATLGKV